MSEETKTNRNNLANAEETIANAIASLPIISSLYGDKKVEVFAMSSESSQSQIKRAIERVLGTTVFVSIPSVDAVQQNKLATAMTTLTVDVIAPFILGEEARSTLDISTDIIELLHLSYWKYPFTRGKPIVMNGMSSSISEDSKTIIRSLTFTCFVDLNSSIETQY